VTRVRSIATSAGEARTHEDGVPLSGQSRSPRVVLVLGHGAGGGVQSGDLLALAHGDLGAGVAVVRMEQPWHVAGRRVAPPPARLDVAWTEVVQRVRADVGENVPVVVGGRSAGARVACRTAADLGAVAVLAIAFPLHPPGRPERSRGEELRAPLPRPVVVVQGRRDPFGRPEEITGEPDLREVRVHDVPGDHSLRDESVGGVLVAVARGLLEQVSATSGSGAGPLGVTTSTSGRETG
jgi:predicted alpha/beta-hydrolase family hydrolase